MNLSFYSAAVGAEQQQQRLNVQSNNIANISTSGFKAQKPSFSTLMYGTIQGVNNETLTRGTGAAVTMADTDFEQGTIVPTQRALDYAIDGDGFFALYDPRTQQVSYTRDGSFIASVVERQNAAGETETVKMLSDGDGRFVLSDRGKTIELTNETEKPAIGVYTFASKDGMQRLDANRYVPVAKNGPALFGTGTVVSGSLEQSNADLGEQLVKVIEAQRSYSYALKMVQTSDEIESTVNALRT